MSTVTPPDGSRSAPGAPAPPRPDGRPTVRAAGPADVAGLYRLSRAFAGTRQLRERSEEEYTRAVGDFLVVDSVSGDVEGCVGLRHTFGPDDPPADRTAVVYNFCVAARGQGRGLGSALLGAALAEAAARSAATVFTATGGGAELFLRHGFTVVEGAADAWPTALDPREGSRVLRLAL
ncbi:GNAT family N-acetyltransferase [Streptomyces sp. NPDC127039]|uniref:GNAT family N-acetyltransferase n=1 Tax=Streptomyces sp. NPDC127039 TaxID=3347115 RepID=UPI003661A49F